jgi:hypothetical protein
VGDKYKGLARIFSHIGFKRWGSRVWKSTVVCTICEKNYFILKKGLLETMTDASEMVKEELGSQRNGKYNYGSRGGPIQDLNRI